MASSSMGLFLDRDGTINTEVDFLRSPDELVLLPHAARVIREANHAGIRVIVITNQSGVARGYLTEADLRKIHTRLAELLEREDARLDAVYYCPHHPTAGTPPYNISCDCRKPAPGMILRGMREFSLDPAKSFVVGDRCVDMQAGRAAGCRTILVQTGYGETERAECEERQCVDAVCADIGEAWNTIRRTAGLSHQKRV